MPYFMSPLLLRLRCHRVSLIVLTVRLVKVAFVRSSRRPTTNSCIRPISRPMITSESPAEWQNMLTDFLSPCGDGGRFMFLARQDRAAQW